MEMKTTKRKRSLRSSDFEDSVIEDWTRQAMDICIDRGCLDRLNR